MYKIRRKHKYIDRIREVVIVSCEIRGNGEMRSFPSPCTQMIFGFVPEKVCNLVSQKQGSTFFEVHKIVRSGFFATNIVKC